MFLSEWREFPSEPCLAGKKVDDSSCLDFVEIARVPEMLPSFFLPGPAKDLLAPRYHGHSSAPEFLAYCSLALTLRNCTYKIVCVCVYIYFFILGFC